MRYLLAAMQTALFALAGLISLLWAGPAYAEILIGVPAPYTGPNGWWGEETERGAELAVEHLNAAGGLFGQTIRITKADDYCDAEQAVAAANKLIAEGVDFVMGHDCSDAAIPASRVYAEAGILMMTPGATIPLLTEQGLENVFRIRGRSDGQAAIAGELLAERWGDQRIAIFHNGQAVGRDIAERVKKSLNARGVREAMFEATTPGLTDYGPVVEKIRSANIDVLYYGGRAPEAGLLIRQLRDRGDDLQLIGGTGIDSENFALIAGAAADGTLFTSSPDPRHSPLGAEVLAAFRATNYEPFGPAPFQAYGAVQAWAQAVEKAGTVEPKAVAAALRTHQFDTVFGTIGFDAKGDVIGYQTFVWYVWQGGYFSPVDPTQPSD